MPEYLSPGVYVEEVSFRAKFIEGVSTSTCGIVGQTSFGPTYGRPEVVTSFSDFQNRYGGWDDLVYGDGSPPQINFTAHAVRAFFDNGGKRIYVARVFRVPPETPPEDKSQYGRARIPAPPGGTALATVSARHPGSWGNKLRVKTLLMTTGTANLVSEVGSEKKRVLRGAYEGAVVQTADAALEQAELGAEGAQLGYVHIESGVATLLDAEGGPLELPPFAYLLELQFQVFVGDVRVPTALYSNIGPNPRARNYVGKYFNPDSPADPGALIAVTVNDTAEDFDVGQLLFELVAATAAFPNGVLLEGGNDGNPPDAVDYQGLETEELRPTGLVALGQVDDISIVMAPDAAAVPANTPSATPGDLIRHAAINNHLITHSENMRYRFAILDEPKGMTSGQALGFRARFDSSYAGIYYPWIEISDPRDGHSGELLALPPSGSMAGIYARTDINRGVWKAPANEPVRDALDFEFHIHKGVQDVLNPRGINCLRYFEQGGFRVWGARTISSDPEWKYINVRRLFLFLEHSIDNGTRWVVFEPNNELTWSNVRQAVSDFLLTVWKDGALVGTKPEQAFFVRCDRTTMTQNDLDNGRLICLIGVAPAYPAEFVIFRIGQFTADSKTT